MNSIHEKAREVKEKVNTVHKWFKIQAMRADKREQRRGERRGEMLDAAMRVVLEGGLESLTIARLARELGVAGGALYRYFSGKDAVVVALQERAVESFRAVLEEDLNAARASAESSGANTQVRALLLAAVAPTSYLAHGTRAPGLHRLLDRSLSHPTALLTDEEARQVDEALAPLLRLCASQLEHAAECSALTGGDANVRTHLLWAATHGLDHFRKRDRIQPASLRVPALTNALLMDLFVGWGANRAQLDEALSALRDLNALRAGDSRS